MAKNKSNKKGVITMEDFSFLEGDDICESHVAMNDLFANLLQATNHQVQAALELTRIIVDKMQPNIAGEEKIFGIYRQALQVIVTATPLQRLLDKVRLTE